MARLYANENFPRPVVEALRRAGHDVTTSADAGQAGRAVPDEDVLAFALADGRAVLTLNRKHFFALHAAGHPHAGVVACTYDPDFAGQAARIDAAVAAAGDLRNQVVRVNRPNPPAGP